MPKKHYVYSKEPAFINRKEELEYLNSWISQRPDNILFLRIGLKVLFFIKKQLV